MDVGKKHVYEYGNKIDLRFRSLISSEKLVLIEVQIMRRGSM